MAALSEHGTYIKRSEARARHIFWGTYIDGKSGMLRQYSFFFVEISEIALMEFKQSLSLF